MKRLYMFATTMLLAGAAIAAAPAMQFHLRPAAPLKPHTATNVTATLTHADGQPVTLAELKEVHKSKLHLLIVDPSLSDYHHIHPVEGSKPGDYSFEFTPQLPGAYRAWADVTDARTGKHDYIQADMGVPEKTVPAINRTPILVSDAGGFHFVLTLDGDLKVGEATMASIAITKDGKPFNQLEPVMGAYAHVVGFAEDYHSILHIHPMGEEPKKDSERGGPSLDLHFEPEHAGFVKLFAQIRVNGQDIFAPFGVVVKPASAPVAEHHHHE